jgi:hypothetical protein
MNVFTNPLMDPEGSKSSSWARRFVALFTKPLMEPEGSLPCLQILLWTQKIYYRVYKASCGPRRSITVFTNPLMDPENSLPCLQSL